MNWQVKNWKTKAQIEPMNIDIYNKAARVNFEMKQKRKLPVSWESISLNLVQNESVVVENEQTDGHDESIMHFLFASVQKHIMPNACSLQKQNRFETNLERWYTWL